MLKTTKKKLKLTTETVVKLRDNLTDVQLAGVAGGALPVSDPCGSSTRGGNC